MRAGCAPASVDTCRNLRVLALPGNTSGWPPGGRTGAHADYRDTRSCPDRGRTAPRPTGSAPGVDRRCRRARTILDGGSRHRIALALADLFADGLRLRG